MKTNVKLGVMSIVILFITQPSLKAQDKFEVNFGADVVSRYVWRGEDQESGASVQPELSFAYKGFSLSAWGSTSISELEPKEFDITLAYGIGGFGIGITDYWWAGQGSPYGHYSDSHFFEAELSYNFGEKFPLTLSVATMLAGADKKEDDPDKQNFSTYISAGYDINLPSGVTLTPLIGFTPHRSLYSNGKKGALSEISLTASKDVKISNSLSLPVFVQAIVAPAYDQTYLVFGVNF